MDAYGLYLRPQAEPKLLPRTWISPFHLRAHQSCNMIVEVSRLNLVTIARLHPLIIDEETNGLRIFLAIRRRQLRAQISHLSTRNHKVSSCLPTTRSVYLYNALRFPKALSNSQTSRSAQVEWVEEICHPQQGWVIASSYVPRSHLPTLPYLTSSAGFACTSR